LIEAQRKNQSQSQILRKKRPAKKQPKEPQASPKKQNPPQNQNKNKIYPSKIQ